MDSWPPDFASCRSGSWISRILEEAKSHFGKNYVKPKSGGAQNRPCGLPTGIQNREIVTKP
jgi:hypothetical protein